MQASETRLKDIIEGSKQYLVPLFQRPYSWEKREWGSLWDDLDALLQDETIPYHFIGSIVTLQTTSVPQGVTKYLLIDGQQRLTTIFILFTLIRDKARQMQVGKLADQIQDQVLVNKYSDGQDYYRLLPTQIDRHAFCQLIDQPDQARTPNGITRCYDYFHGKLTRFTAEQLKQLTEVIMGRLSVVSIVLDTNDNPHLVFESLNAKGKPLTQADLVRNFFFMRVHTNQQDTVYRQHWQPMQEALGDDLTEFIRQFLIQQRSAPIRIGDIYMELKRVVGDSMGEQALATLQNIHTFATFYKRLIEPQAEPNPAIRKYLERLQRLDQTTVHPFLLKCYADYARAVLSADEFMQILQVIENFLVRRIVCSIPSSQLNKIFPVLYGWVQNQVQAGHTFVEGLKLELQNRDYPSDAAFKKSLMSDRLYGAGDRRDRTRFILETIEASYEHKEPILFDRLSIEHVMPQKLSQWWVQHLGDGAEEDHTVYVHTLGNLTLTGYNSELSNSSFPEKQKQLAESHLELNRYFRSCGKWTSEEIQHRAEELADRAIHIWAYFGSKQRSASILTPHTATGKTPTTLTLLGQRIPVRTWSEVLTQTLQTIAEQYPEGFEQFARDYPRVISDNPAKLKRGTQLSNGMHVELNMSASRVVFICQRAVALAELHPNAWQVEVRESGADSTLNPA